MAFRIRHSFSLARSAISLATSRTVAPRAIPFRALCVSAPVQSAQAKSFDGRDWTDPAVLEDHAEKIFNDPNTDGWAIRQCFNEMQVMDGFAEIRVLAAGLKACRRINDYALAVRFLESLARKTGGYKTELWAYIKKELQPTLTQLGIQTPEEMGYDKPELALQDVYDM